MNSKEELILLKELIKKHNLPLSPILEYSIAERLSEFATADQYSNNRNRLSRTVSDRATKKCHSNQFYKSVNEKDNELSKMSNNNDEYAFQTKIGYSFFVHGFIVPKSKWDVILAAVQIPFQNWNSIPIQLIIGSNKFKIKIETSRRSSSKEDTSYVRIMWGNNDSIRTFLESKLKETYRYIIEAKRKNPKARNIQLPIELQHYAKIFTTSEKNIFKMSF